jgi:aspartyl-tRNA(Asn)/glutamyl-tRNA(Gln) amidotransferase subunit A
MAGDEFAYRSAEELIAGYASGQFSPVEVTEAMLDRIERLNPELNAFTDVTADIARESAKHAEAEYRAGTAGPLSGVPVTIKDITFVEGLRCRRGSKIYADDSPASFSSPFVQRVIEAGAVLLGQTTTPELGWKGETSSPLSGTTRNPWNLERTPGGSSGSTRS